MKGLREVKRLRGREMRGEERGRGGVVERWRGKWWRESEWRGSEVAKWNAEEIVIMFGLSGGDRGHVLKVGEMQM